MREALKELREDFVANQRQRKLLGKQSRNVSNAAQSLGQLGGITAHTVNNFHPQAPTPIPQSQWSDRKKLLLGSIVAPLLVAGIVYFFKGSPSVERAPVKEIPIPLLSLQLEAIKNLQDFIGGKNEYELDEIFDFNKVVQFNTRMVRQRFAPRTVSQDQAAEIAACFKDGESRVDIRYADIHENKSGAPTVKIKPGKVGFINTTRKYIDARRQLAKLAALPGMPLNVVVAVTNLDNTIEKNSDLLVDVLEEKVSENINSIIYDEDVDSPFLGTVNSSYFKKFSPLKTEADGILKQTKIYLESIRN